jgi:hypothetical protein
VCHAHDALVADALRVVCTNPRGQTHQLPSQYPWQCFELMVRSSDTLTTITIIAE